jgi:hypothetical protein
VTLLFESGAIIQQAYFGRLAAAAISGGGHQYLVIDGGAKGIMQTTLNGSNGTPAGSPVATCLGGACQYENPSAAIDGNCSNCTIQNLTFPENYVYGTCYSATPSTSCDQSFLYGTGDITFYNNAASAWNNVTIQNNSFTWCQVCVIFENQAVGSNWIIRNNSFTKFDVGLILASHANFSSVYIYGNKWSDMAVWDSGLPAPGQCPPNCTAVIGTFHHEFLHFYQGATADPVTANVFFYNNEGDGPVGDCCVAGHLFFENNRGGAISGGVFNNVLTYADGDCTATCTTGMISVNIPVISGSSFIVANNTIIGDATNARGAAYAGSSGGSGVSGVTWENNIFQQMHILEWDLTGLTWTANYNLYAEDGGSGCAFKAGNTCYFGSQYSTWASAVGGGENSAYYPSAAILPTCNSTSDCSNVRPASGSHATGFGANLYSLCNGQRNPGLGALCYDKAGNARSSSGTWTAGAYGNAPTPPTGLKATVN